MPHSAPSDCPRAPRCTAAACHPEHDPVPVSWVVLFVDAHRAPFLATVWRHPRYPETHRSEAGEPVSGPPKWTRP